MRHNVNLSQERMDNQGLVYSKEDFLVNGLYGLDDLCKEFIKPNMNVLELGSHNGVSTNLFAKYANHVTCVDMANTIGINNVVNTNTNVTFHNMLFSDFFKTNTSKFDLIYIDGDHTYESVLNDIENSLPLLTYNGVMCGHDCNEFTPGVEQAVKQCFPNSELRIFSDSSWLVQLES